MSIGQIILRRLGFLVKIFIKKIILICNKVYKDLMANKTRKTSAMTIKASDANELLCDNNTGKTYHVNRSYL